MDQISQQDLFRWIGARKDAMTAQQFLQLTQEIMQERYNLAEKDAVDFNTGIITREKPKAEEK
jgi:hypothetical protein